MIACFTADELFAQYDAAIAVGATQVANRILSDYDRHAAVCADCKRSLRDDVPLKAMP